MAQVGGTLRRVAGRVAKVSLIVVLNTLALFVIANIVAEHYLNRDQPAVSDEQRRRMMGDAAIARNGMEVFRRVYPDKTDDEIRQLLHDQPELPNAYEPFVDFRSAAISTSTINIHQAGFRIGGKDQASWPLDRNAINVFVFGGSTTVGSGVDDGKTIPAALQAILRSKTRLPINVYNFGVGAYFSSQEVTYFQNQLRYGYVPDMVVFIDGLNDFHFWDGDPATAKNYRQTFYLMMNMSRQLGREQGVAWHVVELAKSLPLVRLARKIGADSTKTSAVFTPAGQTGWMSQANAAPAGDDLYAKTYKDSFDITDPVRIEAVMVRYLTNKDIAQGIATQFGIDAVFAWQPVPLYKYDLAKHPFRVEDEHRRGRYGYPAMARLAATRDLGPGFVWCADVLQDVKHAVYVDQVHYNEEGNRLVAACIADKITASGAIERIGKRKPAQVAAAARQELAALVETAPAEIRTMTRLFGTQSLIDSLDVSRPVSEWDAIGAGGVELKDASSGFGVVSQDFPLDHESADRTFQVSVRIKPSTSDYTGLVMLCFGGATQESSVVFFNPKTMGVIGASGHHQLTTEPDGWERLALTGSCRDAGNDKLKVMLFPAHGTAENRGAVIFGGGEISRIVAAQAGENAR